MRPDPGLQGLHLRFENRANRANPRKTSLQTTPKTGSKIGGKRWGFRFAEVLYIPYRWNPPFGVGFHRVYEDMNFMTEFELIGDWIGSC